MTARLTGADALLAIAAAETRLELHRAYLALIDSGEMLTLLEPCGGGAGRHLLGDDQAMSTPRVSLARRARNIAERQRVAWRNVGDVDEPLEPPPGAADRCPGSTFGLVHRPNLDRYADCRTCGHRRAVPA